MYTPVLTTPQGALIYDAYVELPANETRDHDEEKLCAREKRENFNNSY